MCGGAGVYPSNVDDVKYHIQLMLLWRALPSKGVNLSSRDPDITKQY